MSRMFPPYISEEVKSTGERQIFELFKNDPATKDWVVLHSLGLAKHTKRLYGEIDFVVMAPSLGIFCLEVKSGAIGREQGVWRFTNRFGETATKTRGPFEQAQEGMFSLIKAIKNKYGEKSKMARVLYGFGVMFPHISFQLVGTEYEAWQIYDRDSRRLPVSSYIIQLFKQTKRKVEHSSWFDENLSLPSSDDINKLLAFLRPDFERLVSPVQIITGVEEQIERYTVEQYYCLDQLQDNPRCLFQGAAGTGKTMIALESVRRGLFDNKRILMVCFNVLLGKWLSSLFPESINSSLTIGSFHQFLAYVSKHIHKYDCDEDYFKYELPLRALDAIDQGDVKPFDKIIIDEGQDLICNEYLDVFDALLKGGLSGGNWEIYCDFERQAIYSDISPEEMLQILDKRVHYVKFRLTVNCRNTRPIGEETALISGFEKPPFLPGKVEGLPVEYFFYKDMNDQAKVLEEFLLKTRKQHIPPSLITVLSPNKFKNSAVSKIERNEFNIIDITSNHQAFIIRKSITFSTIQSFKGLENSHIIIADINRLNDSEFKSLLYIGMSRAKVRLTVLIDVHAKNDYVHLLKRLIR